MNEQVTITLPSRFDYSYHKEFQALCAKSIDDAEVKHIIFDFSRVEYLDSAALGMMMMWQRRADVANKKMMIKGAKGTAAQILSVANMQKIFEYI
jgi:HptB-dependent secretion and biofilm anti anti-sigma factor